MTSFPCEYGNLISDCFLSFSVILMNYESLISHYSSTHISPQLSTRCISHCLWARSFIHLKTILGKISSLPAANLSLMDHKSFRYTALLCNFNRVEKNHLLYCQCKNFYLHWQFYSENLSLFSFDSNDGFQKMI